MDPQHSDESAPTDGPRVAVAPSGTREYVESAVRDGGGRIVEPAEAEALVWTDPDDPEGLRSLLADAPDIRWVQLPWAGIEPYVEAGVIDAEHRWTSGKGVYARPVAEHALALTLAGLRDLRRFTAAGTWESESGISLVGGNVTIFGGGGIADELIALLAPFDVEITVVRRHAEPMDGVERVLAWGERYDALKQADAVILALALTDETAGAFGREEFEVMAPHAWLVNVARGGHVVTSELVEALRNDIIGGAALDVTDPEPLPDGHPLWSLPNCIVTPHVANTEDMARPLLSARIAENVRRFGAGEELLGVVDADLGY